MAACNEANGEMNTSYPLYLNGTGNGTWKILELTWPACDAKRYDDAAYECRRIGYHVCSYEDLYFTYKVSGWEIYHNPQGHWIGNMVGDDKVLCGNKNITSDGDPDISNFEGVCSKSNKRKYWCCYAYDEIGPQ
jgi:hypothetical protein